METIEGKGTLEGLAAGDVHGDNVSIEGEGTRSGKKSVMMITGTEKLNQKR